MRRCASAISAPGVFSSVRAKIEDTAGDCVVFTPRLEDTETWGNSLQLEREEFTSYFEELREFFEKRGLTRSKTDSSHIAIGWAGAELDSYCDAAPLVE